MQTRTISRITSPRIVPRPSRASDLSVRTISVDDDEDQVTLPPSTTALVLRKEVK